MIEIIDVEQGSPEWFKARVGLPTASRFSDILAKGEGKTRARYMRDLAAEIIRGAPEEETYTNAHLERGKAQEDDARRMYAFMHDAEPQRVGFIKNGRKGCSPDSLIGEKGGLEIKCALGAIQIERLMKGVCPSEHVAQVQGSLWVTDREWWDFCSYSPGLPLFVARVYRDEPYLATLRDAVDGFLGELDELVEKVRRYGGAT